MHASVHKALRADCVIMECGGPKALSATRTRPRFKMNFGRGDLSNVSRALMRMEQTRDPEVRTWKVRMIDYASMHARVPFRAEVVIFVSSQF